MIHKIRINGNGPTAHGYRIFIDNHDITDGVQEITLNVSMYAANMVTIVCCAEVELPQELEAIVQATQLERGDV